MIETVLVISLMVGVGVFAFKEGKKQGSRQGFAAGHRKHRRRRNKHL